MDHCFSRSSLELHVPFTYVEFLVMLRHIQLCKNALLQLAKLGVYQQRETFAGYVYYMTLEQLIEDQMKKLEGKHQFLSFQIGEMADLAFEKVLALLSEVRLSPFKPILIS